MTSTQRWKTFVCFVLIHVAALSGSATEIHLKQRVDSQGSVVLLGDIADLKEDKSAAGRTRGGRGTDVASLARIELFPAPSVSRVRTIRRQEVRELLALHGVDLKNVSFTGAESVIVQTTKRPRLRNVAGSTNPPFVAMRQPFSNARSTARSNRPAQEPATELVLAPVRDLRRGEVIRQSNVALIRIPVTGFGSAASLGVQPVVETEKVLGMVTKRPIAANQPLDIRSLERRIADIRPNGDVVLEGHKQIQVNYENWEVSLSGICRYQDIGPDNTVLSRQIADLKIVKRDRGHVRDSYKRGWLSRWIDEWSPF